MLYLRETCDSDIDFIADCLKGKGEDFVEQCGYGKRFFKYPVTADQIGRFITDRRSNSRFVIIMNEDKPVGSMELMISKENSFCNIARFLISDEHRFKGYGTLALQKASDYIFNELKLSKVTLNVFDFNESARRCYTKAGFAVTSTEVKPNGWTSLIMEKLP